MKHDSPADSPDASTPSLPQAPAQRPRLNLAKRTVSEVRIEKFLPEGQYDFSYLRIDLSNNLNAECVFACFVHAAFVANCVFQRAGEEWNMCGSLKKCEVSYATIQGIDCLVARFCDSATVDGRYRKHGLSYRVDSQSTCYGR